MPEESEYVQFKLRLPSDLKRWLDHESAISGRSLSSEIINRLHRSLLSVELTMLRNRMSELKLARKEIYQLKSAINKVTEEIAAENDSAKKKYLEEERRAMAAQSEFLTLTSKRLSAEIEQLSKNQGDEDIV